VRIEEVPLNGDEKSVAEEGERANSSQERKGKSRNEVAVWKKKEPDSRKRGNTLVRFSTEKKEKGKMVTFKANGKLNKTGEKGAHGRRTTWKSRAKDKRNVSLLDGNFILARQGNKWV